MAKVELTLPQIKMLRQSKPKKRGGYRAGSGRKPSPDPLKVYPVRLRKATRDKLAKVPNASRWVRELIEANIKNIPSKIEVKSDRDGI